MAFRNCRGVRGCAGAAPRLRGAASLRCPRRSALRGVEHPISQDGADHLHPLPRRRLQGALVLHAAVDAGPGVLPVAALRPHQGVA